MWALTQLQTGPQVQVLECGLFGGESRNLWSAYQVRESWEEAVSLREQVKEDEQGELAQKALPRGTRTLSPTCDLANLQ